MIPFLLLKVSRSKHNLHSSKLLIHVKIQQTTTFRCFRSIENNVRPLKCSVRGATARVGLPHEFLEISDALFVSGRETAGGLVAATLERTLQLFHHAHVLASHLQHEHAKEEEHQPGKRAPKYQVLSKLN